MKSFPAALFVPTALARLPQAQSPAPAPAPSNQITLQVLGKMLRSATTFHGLVQDLNKDLGPDVHKPGPDGIPQHSVERTATTIGVGAGVGAAMAHDTKAERRANRRSRWAYLRPILKHREETHLKPADAPVPETRQTPQ